MNSVRLKGFDASEKKTKLKVNRVTCQLVELKTSCAFNLIMLCLFDLLLPNVSEASIIARFSPTFGV